MGGEGGERLKNVKQAKQRRKCILLAQKGNDGALNNIFTSSIKISMLLLIREICNL